MSKSYYIVEKVKYPITSNTTIERNVYDTKKEAREFFEKSKKSDKDKNIYFEKRYNEFPHKSKRVDFYSGVKK